MTKTITGTPRDDTLRGTARADLIDGRAGNDAIRGLSGNDRLLGGNGNDRIAGGGGRDTIAGGPGNDVISSGTGADRITCGAGVDRVTGDPADQTADDCEQVTGVTPAPPSLEGHYAAAPDDWLAFDVAPGARTVTGLRVILIVPCPDTGFGLLVPLFLTDGFPIQEDGTFAVDYQVSGGFQPRLTLTGRFDGATASGTLRVRATFMGECEASKQWTASRR